jgi:hypothetical protein
MATLDTLRKAQHAQHVNLALAAATMDSVPTMARDQVATRTHLQLHLQLQHLVETVPT